MKKVSLLLLVAGAALIPPGSAAQTKEFQDTLILQTPCVLFYSCTPCEYDSLFQEMTFRLDSLVQQHEQTKKKLIPFLNKMNVPYLSTVASTFVFLGKDTVDYIRQPFHDLAGIVLFSPAKKPEFLPHHSSHMYAIGRIHNYFLLQRKSPPNPTGTN